MTTPVMTFEEVRAALKQRFPMIMVDSVILLEPGKRIQAIKNVTGNEIQFLGHFPEYAVMPGTLIVEAVDKQPPFCSPKRWEPERGQGSF